MKTWIIVCDASRARVYAYESEDEAWTLAWELNHPESRAKDTELNHALHVLEQTLKG